MGQQLDTPCSGVWKTSQPFREKVDLNHHNSDTSNGYGVPLLAKGNHATNEEDPFGQDCERRTKRARVLRHTLYNCDQAFSWHWAAVA